MTGKINDSPSGASTPSRRRALSIWIFFTALALMIPAFVSGSPGSLSAISTKQEVLFTAGRICSESFMWCEDSSFDERWGLGGGILGGGRINPPSGLPNMSVSLRPVPTLYFIRWFHFGEQRFFEARLDDTTLPQKVLEIVNRNSLWDYDEKALIVCILDTHEVQLWLAAAYRPTESDSKLHMELFGTFQGYEVAGGSLDRFIKTTARAIERGRIKPPPGWIQSPTGWIPPASQNKE